MWTTFSPAVPQSQKTLVPGDYSIPTAPITITDAALGVEIVASDNINTVRFLNISLEAKAKTNGNPITVYIGIGFVPTATLHSFQFLSGQQESAFQVGGQQIKAVAETGESIDVNIQIANAVSKIL
jgi:hypothetical protein